MFSTRWGPDGQPEPKPRCGSCCGSNGWVRLSICSLHSDMKDRQWNYSHGCLELQLLDILLRSRYTPPRSCTLPDFAKTFHSNLDLPIIRRKWIDAGVEVSLFFSSTQRTIFLQQCINKWMDAWVRCKILTRVVQLPQPKQVPQRITWTQFKASRLPAVKACQDKKNTTYFAAKIFVLTGHSD